MGIKILKDFLKEDLMSVTSGSELGNVSDINSDDVENKVTSHLLKKEEDDDMVETITFGLETDDGEIVKVYVNIDDADGFEEALSAMLGKYDSIEEVVEELADDFDIVDVVWPNEDENEDEELNEPEKEEEKVASVERKSYGSLLTDKLLKGDKVTESVLTEGSWGFGPLETDGSGGEYFELKEKIEDANNNKNKINVVIFKALSRALLEKDDSNSFNIWPSFVGTYVAANEFVSNHDDFKTKDMLSSLNSLKDKCDTWVDNAIKEAREELKTSYGDDASNLKGAIEEYKKFKRSRILQEDVTQDIENSEFSIDPAAADLLKRYSNPYAQVGLKALMKLGINGGSLKILVARNPGFVRDLIQNMKDLGASNRNRLSMALELNHKETEESDEK